MKRNKNDGRQTAENQCSVWAVSSLSCSTTPVAATCSIDMTAGTDASFHDHADLAPSKLSVSTVLASRCRTFSSVRPPKKDLFAAAPSPPSGRPRRTSTRPSPPPPPSPARCSSPGAYRLSPLGYPTRTRPIEGRRHRDGSTPRGTRRRRQRFTTSPARTPLPIHHQGPKLEPCNPFCRLPARCGCRSLPQTKMNRAGAFRRFTATTPPAQTPPPIHPPGGPPRSFHTVRSPPTRLIYRGDRGLRESGIFFFDVRESRLG